MVANCSNRTTVRSLVWRIGSDTDFTTALWLNSFHCPWKLTMRTFAEEQTWSGGAWHKWGRGQGYSIIQDPDNSKTECHANTQSTKGWSKSKHAEMEQYYIILHIPLWSNQWFRKLGYSTTLWNAEMLVWRRLANGCALSSAHLRSWMVTLPLGMLVCWSNQSQVTIFGLQAKSSFLTQRWQQENLAVFHCYCQSSTKCRLNLKLKGKMILFQGKKIISNVFELNRSFEWGWSLQNSGSSCYEWVVALQ